MPKRWTEQEQILALNLYHLLPFGRLHERAPEIIALAKLMDRTSGSVAMKLCNFASLDPKIIAKGKKGLSNVSRNDRKLWEWHKENQNEFLKKSEEYLTNNNDDDFLSADDVKSIKKSKPTEKTALLKIRVGQPIFRRMILDNYTSTCCYSNLSIPEFLVASHIKPWSVDEAQRLNPKNGLCLSSLHDKAFDLGFWTLNEHGEVVLGSLLRSTDSKVIQEAFFDREGKSLLKGINHEPDPELIDYHREQIFAKREVLAK